MSLSQPKRILVIKLLHHGDVLLSTPVVDAVKHTYPNCEIDMLVYEETADILRDCTQISNVFTIDRQWKKLGAKEHLKQELKLIQALKSREYDWALNLSGKWRAGFISKLCAKSSISLAYEKRDNVLWRGLHDFVNPELGMSYHVVISNLGVLEPLVPLENYAPKVLMGISDSTRETAQQKLKEQGWQGERYVVIHPGSRWFFKCWEDGKYAAIIQLLLNNGHHVVLTAAPSDDEQKMIQEITSRVNVPEQAKLWTLSGNLNLRELAAVIDGADLFVGVDSVPMHIAAALDKPQVALFGPSWVSRWRPYSTQAEVIWAGDFGELPHPNSINTADKSRCLGAIPLEPVWQAISNKLQN